MPFSRFLTVILFVAPIAPIAPAVAQDRVRYESAFSSPIAVTSAGVTIRGTIFVAAGRGPHATVIHLQGFPGSNSTEFEEYLQAQGFNAVSVFVRGQQTSEGQYSVSGMPEDA